MSANTDHLNSFGPESAFNPFIIDRTLRTDIFATMSRFDKLARRSGKLVASKFMGSDEPAYTSNSPYQPARRVELHPDLSHIVTTSFGTDHLVDVYNADSLGTERSDLAPLVLTMELSVPSTKGIKAPVIEALGEFCTKQNRSLIVVSSEGFEGRCPSVRQIKDLDFTTMTHNVMDSIDELEQLERVEIPTITTTGGSRGGTLSLLLATSGVAARRYTEGKPPRRISGVTAFAPAGLNRNSLPTAWQFAYDEPSHMIRKASGMNPDVLEDYATALLETLSPFQAKSAIAKTALLYVLTKPLANISERLEPDVDVDIVVLDKDGLTSPKQWHQEMEHYPGSNVFEMPGSHLSIDSLRRVYRITAWHLDGRDMRVVEAARSIMK